MTSGTRNSSVTRVSPVFERLVKQPGDWVRQLLGLPKFGASAASIPSAADLTFVEGYWGDKERGLQPPVSLLSWLIRNLQPPAAHTTIDGNRQALLAGDAGKVEEALWLLRGEGSRNGWHVSEGPTFPDALIVTPDALVVVEGKRTESGPTTSTTWLVGRHQIWRHIDAAWEIRGRRHVFGLFIVEGDGGFAVPRQWREAAFNTVSASVLESSFPHRGPAERRGIADCFLGVTTWQEVCSSFGIVFNGLPDVVPAASG